jgi:uncharacterized membrane protein YraQ (UPF0718 family)
MHLTVVIVIVFIRITVVLVTVLVVGGIIQVIIDREFIKNEWPCMQHKQHVVESAVL